MDREGHKAQLYCMSELLRQVLHPSFHITPNYVYVCRLVSHMSAHTYGYCNTLYSLLMSHQDKQLKIVRVVFSPCVHPSAPGMSWDAPPCHDHGFSHPLYWALRARRMAPRSCASSAAYVPCGPGMDPYGRGRSGNKNNVNLNNH